MAHPSPRKHEIAADKGRSNQSSKTRSRSKGNNRLPTDDFESCEDARDNCSSSGWEDGHFTEKSSDSNINDKTFFHKLAAGTTRNSPESLITKMLHQNGPARPGVSPHSSSVAFRPRNFTRISSEAKPLEEKDEGEAILTNARTNGTSRRKRD